MQNERPDPSFPGQGIEAKHIPRLTERFYRVDTDRSRQTGGTGLGLAIVKQIIQRYEGRLTIQSTPGEGSTFSCVMPKKIAVFQDEGLCSPQKKPSAYFDLTQLGDYLSLPASC
jgi:hypothetical protein